MIISTDGYGTYSQYSGTTITSYHCLHRLSTAGGEQIMCSIDWAICLRLDSHGDSMHPSTTMPELPDLEVIRAVLVQRIVDVPILSVEVLRPLIVRNLLEGMKARLEPRPPLVNVRRRGKFLLLPLDDGER